MRHAGGYVMDHLLVFLNRTKKPPHELTPTICWWCGFLRLQIPHEAMYYLYIRND